MGRGGGRGGGRGRRGPPVGHPGRHLGALRAGRAFQPVVPGAAARGRAPPCCAGAAVRHLQPRPLFCSACVLAVSLCPHASHSVLSNELASGTMYEFWPVRSINVLQAVRLQTLFLWGNTKHTYALVHQARTPRSCCTRARSARPGQRPAASRIGRPAAPRRRPPPRRTEQRRGVWGAWLNARARPCSAAARQRARRSGLLRGMSQLSRAYGSASHAYPLLGVTVHS